MASTNAEPKDKAGYLAKLSALAMEHYADGLTSRGAIVPGSSSFEQARLTEPSIAVSASPGGQTMAEKSSPDGRKPKPDRSSNARQR